MRLACLETNAVAALFIDEFNNDNSDNGYRVCCMHWCYPEDAISESDFFTVDPIDGDMNEIEEYDTNNVPDELMTWLDQALLSAMSPSPRDQP